MSIGPVGPPGDINFKPTEEPSAQVIQQLQSLLSQLDGILKANDPLTQASINQIGDICSQIKQILQDNPDIIFDKCSGNGWPSSIGHDGYQMRYSQLLEFVTNFPEEAAQYKPSQMGGAVQMINESLTQLLYFLTSKH